MLNKRYVASKRTAKSGSGVALNQTEKVLSYPSIRQSLVICAIIFLMSLGCVPIFFLGKFGGIEVAMLMYYVATFGSSFYIVHSLRRRRIGSSEYNFVIPSWLGLSALPECWRLYTHTHGGKL